MVDGSGKLQKKTLRDVVSKSCTPTQEVIDFLTESGTIPLKPY